MFNLNLTKQLSYGQSSEDGTRWVTFETACGFRVVFWGSPDGLDRGNVTRLKNRELPIEVQVDDDFDNCVASPTVKKRYKCSLSVSEITCVTVVSD